MELKETKTDICKTEQQCLFSETRTCSLTVIHTFFLAAANWRGYFLCVSLLKRKHAKASKAAQAQVELKLVTKINKFADFTHLGSANQTSAVCPPWIKSRCVLTLFSGLHAFRCLSVSNIHHKALNLLKPTHVDHMHPHICTDNQTPSRDHLKPLQITLYGRQAAVL